jgi:hypothetical protein
MLSSREICHGLSTDIAWRRCGITAKKRVLPMRNEAASIERLLLADTVANVENRTAPKISRKSIFRSLYRWNAP